MITNDTPKNAAMRLVQKKISEGFKFTALYEWTNEQGEIIFWVIRLDPPPSHRKEFRPMHTTDQGNYALGLPNFPNGKPLYRLHKIGSVDNLC